MTMLIPPADLEVAGFGRCYAGQPVDIPADLAGEAPDPRYDPAHVELRDALAAGDHDRAGVLRDEIAGLYPGRGLLAQGWREPTKAEAKAAEKTAGQAAGDATSDPGDAGASEGN